MFHLKARGTWAPFIAPAVENSRLFQRFLIAMTRWCLSGSGPPWIRQPSVGEKTV